MGGSDRQNILRATLISLVATPLLAALCVLLLAAALTVPDAAARNIAEDAVLLEHKRIHGFTGKKIDVGTECIGVSFGLGDTPGRSPFEAAIAAPVIFECVDLLAHVRGGGEVPRARGTTSITGTGTPFCRGRFWRRFPTMISAWSRST